MPWKRRDVENERELKKTLTSSIAVSRCFPFIEKRTILFGNGNSKATSYAVISDPAE
jgi:hypothetical protein